MVFNGIMLIHQIPTADYLSNTYKSEKPYSMNTKYNKLTRQFRHNNQKHK